MIKTQQRNYGLAQTVAPSQENNILRGLDCWLSARAFVERRTQRPSPLGTSAFEIFPEGKCRILRHWVASIAQREMQSHAAT
jgi:hypothetical protein